MTAAGKNMASVRNENRSALLRLLNSRKVMSRKDLAAELDLTPAAVTILCRSLLEEGLIEEKGEISENGRAGRKKILLKTCLEKFYAVTVNMETDVTTVAFAGLDGHALSKEVFATHGDVRAQVPAVTAAVNRALAANSDLRSSVLGIGIGTVGNYDAAGILHGRYSLWDSDVDFGRILNEHTGLPCASRNNVKAFAAAQMIYADGYSGNIFFIKWGAGIGSASAYDGRISDSSSELGHYITDPGGKECRCGRRGCLELYASGNAITASIREVFSADKTPELYKLTGGDTEKIASFVFSGGGTDALVRDIIDKSVKRFARAIVNSAAVLSPDKVVLFGKYVNDDSFSLLKENCKMYMADPEDGMIVQSPLQSKADFIGPAALVADKFFFG